MLFFTIIFLCFYTTLLLKGSLLGEKNIKIVELSIEKENIDREYKKKEIDTKIIKLASPYFFILFMVLIETIFLTVVIKSDPLKYPTILMLLHTIYSFAKSFGRKKEKFDLTTENGKNKALKQAEKESKRGLKSIIVTFLNIVYFTYIFYILTF